MEPLPAVARHGARRPDWPDGRRRPSGLDAARRRAPRVVRGWATALAVAAGALLVLPAVRPVGFDDAVRSLVDGPEAFWRWLDGIGGALRYRTLWLPVAAVLVWTARWRHLLAFVGTVSVTAAVAQLAAGDARLAEVVREGVTGSPEAYELPAWPVVVLSAVAAAAVLVLTPSGRARRWGWAVAALLVALLGGTRVALGHTGAAVTLASVVVGAGAAALACHLLAPEARFPVTYRRTVTAHLQLDGGRTDRVRVAVRDQLGLTLTALEPYRLDGSAGSTPCRLQVAEDPPRVLFGKLYATGHVRSDRWYKLARVLRYGRLEDEAPFTSVRRLAEHEDYMLRLLRDGGVRVPEPVGVVEVEAGREYLLVTELVPDAVELLDAPVDDAVVDDALDQVRRLWAAGAAHRDVKPSNLLVRGRQVYLVDVSFGELRPSRWRQAVDLADMLLVLALAVEPARLVQRAEAFFSGQELAEAFAATSSLTVPRQLRRRIEATGRDLVAEFAALLPPHPRVRVQRWSMRRVLLAVATVGGVLLTAVLVALNLRAGGLL
ncbi:RIO1 family regulatory kinase/ATPase [Blastococcus sp. SYSU D00669]